MKKTKKQTKKQTKKEIKILIWIIAMVIVFGTYTKHNQWGALTLQASAPMGVNYGFLPEAEDKEMTIVDKIWYYGNTANPHNLDPREAIKIAQCESSLGKQKRNKQGSSASGVFMFINKTWDSYCEGYQMNDDDNIKCFYKLYPLHKSWWECKI